MNPQTQNLINQANQAGQSASAVTGVAWNNTPSFSGGQTSMRRNIEPTVSAGSIANPPVPVTVPQPQQAPQPSNFVQNLNPVIESGNAGVQTLGQNIIQAQTQEADQRNNLLNQILNQEFGSSQNTYQSALNQNLQNITGQDPDSFMQGLADANTTLAMLQGKFRSAGQNISSAQGQSKVFEGAQLNELSRQEAVEVGNQALLVQAMQGNFDTARQIALETANFASQDQQTQLNNAYKQLDALTGIVDQQTQQLIDQEKAKIQAEQQDIQRTQGLVDSAILEGSATVGEMQQLTSTSVSNQEKQAIAMRIINRSRGADKAFDRGIQNAKTFGVDTTDTSGTPQANVVSTIDNILANQSGLEASAGTTQLGRRGVGRVGDKTGFIASVENLISGMTLQSLIDAKANGATFGALSEGELRMLAETATKISNWRKTDKDGRVIGYRTSEANLKKELQFIQDKAKKDYEKKTGIPYLSDEELLNPMSSANVIYNY